MSTKKKRARSKRGARAKAKGAGEPRMLKVTYPDGRKETVPADGRSFPEGTMLQWDDVRPSGHTQMGWCVVGGWPFDD